MNARRRASPKSPRVRAQDDAGGRNYIGTSRRPPRAPSSTTAHIATKRTRSAFRAQRPRRRRATPTRDAFKDANFKNSTDRFKT